MSGFCEHVNKTMGYVKGKNTFAIKISDLLKKTEYQTSVSQSVTIKVIVLGGAPQNHHTLRTVGPNDEEE